MKPSVLVISPNSDEASELVDKLRWGGFQPTCVRGLSDVTDDASREARLLIVDVRIGPEEISTFIRTLRIERDVPVLALGSEEEVGGKIAALRAGADGVVRSALAMEELIERVKAHLRRPTLRRTDAIVFGAVSIDLDGRLCTVHGADARLTRVEFDLVAALLRRRGQAVSRTWLANTALRDRSESAERNLNVHMSHLRRKLGSDGAAIETLRGAGYRLSLPDEPADR